MLVDTTTGQVLAADHNRVEELHDPTRERVLDEHTYAHRARQLLALAGLAVPVGAGG